MYFLTHPIISKIAIFSCVYLIGCAPRAFDRSSGLNNEEIRIRPFNDLDQAQKNDNINKEFLRIDAASPSKIDGLDANARDLLLQDAKAHPVARLDQLETYDPQKLTGFCFGRAMAVHTLARERGVKPLSIKKQFIVGDLKASEAKQTEWRFHVTTLVKGNDGKWYAIDPIFPRVLTQVEWIQKTRSIWDEWYKTSNIFKEPQSRIYVVNRHGVLPEIRSFVPPEHETGEHLIELSFNPTNFSGFTREPKIASKAYTLDEAATEKFFLTTSELSKNDRFNFLGLAFQDGLYINYNEYFQHLIFGIPDKQQVDPRIARQANDDNNRQIYSGSISINFEKILKMRKK